MIGNFPAVLNFNQLFLKLNRLFVTNCRFSPIIGVLNSRQVDMKASGLHG